ncbi:MAG: hypothetical protein RLZZ337_918 [Bacteroidota bacterium]|jgi:LysM repeat protein
MNRTLLFSFVLICSTSVFGQTSAVLDANNTSIVVSGKGQMILQGDKKAYVVPKKEKETDLERSTIYASGLWLVGTDDKGKLHAAAATYGQKGSDFAAGPSSFSKTVTQTRYDKVWKVTREDIAKHCLNPKNPIDAIKTWPGNGDTSIGEPWLLAPFVDINDNSKYEPELGDYPKIKGAISAYCVYNDNLDYHPESKGVKLNVDVHQLFYQEDLNCLDGILDHTNLAWFKIVNRSKNTYTDLRIGVFMDFDLGYYGDDYFGTDTLRNMSYAYNGDIFDDGPLGYGLNPPAQGVKYLNQPLAASLSYNNNSNSINGNPASDSNFYFFLQGKNYIGEYFWQTRETVDGIDTIYSPFYLAGDPVTSTVLVDNTPSDRRGISAIGPFTLPPNESICFDIAYIYARATFGSNLQSVKSLQDVADHVQFAYNQDYNGWKSYECQENEVASVNEIQKNQINIYPNPTSGIVMISLPLGETFEVYNALGEQLLNVKRSDNQVDLTEYANGIYFVKTRFDTFRLIKH